jgi:hypothetical protein
MKFYREKNSYSFYFYDHIIFNKLNSICISTERVIFFKNGEYHNSKNASYIRCDGYKAFHLNAEYYGNESYFTKESWRRFVKLMVFL